MKPFISHTYVSKIQINQKICQNQYLNICGFACEMKGSDWNDVQPLSDKLLVKFLLRDCLFWKNCWNCLLQSGKPSFSWWRGLDLSIEFILQHNVNENFCITDIRWMSKRWKNVVKNTSKIIIINTIRNCCWIQFLIRQWTNVTKIRIIEIIMRWRNQFSAAKIFVTSLVQIWACKRIFKCWQLKIRKWDWNGCRIKSGLILILMGNGRNLIAIVNVSVNVICNSANDSYCWGNFVVSFCWHDLRFSHKVNPVKKKILPNSFWQVLNSNFFFNVFYSFGIVADIVREVLIIFLSFRMKLFTFYKNMIKVKIWLD